MQTPEPIFSRQEQGVVYFFSRHWEHLPDFAHKKILRIHTRFPDFSIVGRNDREEAIEFEYGLSALRSHLTWKKRKCFRRLHDDGVRLLYVVYWDENDEKDELHREIKHAGFTGQIKFVCLKDYFGASVFKNRRSRKTEPWQASWTFTKKRTTPRQAYRVKDIQRAVTQLVPSIELLQPDKDLYRVTGFDKSAADFIECDHWEKIHFYTTSARFGREEIPGKLFVKPTGFKYFNGYFDIKRAFIIRRGSKPVKQFFTDYYFYPYQPHYRTSKCFVCNFRPLQYEQGKELYKFLKAERYDLRSQSSILIKRKHNATIDAIVASQHGGSR